jgi:hypothetical protein
LHHARCNHEESRHIQGSVNGTLREAFHFWPLLSPTSSLGHGGFRDSPNDGRYAGPGLTRPRRGSVSYITCASYTSVGGPQRADIWAGFGDSGTRRASRQAPTRPLANASVTGYLLVICATAT